MALGHLPMEQMECFRKYVEIADWAWEVTKRFPAFARDTVGIQLVRACDSVGANLVEGDGRSSAADGLRFLIIARGSAREAKFWIERAITRNLVSREEGLSRIQDINNATRMLNVIIKHRRTAGNWEQVAEPPAEYCVSEGDPFSDTAFDSN